MDDRGSPTEEPPCDVEMTSQRDAGSPPPRPDKMPVETSAAAIATPETNEAYHAHPQEPRERRDSHGALPARGPDLMITDHAPVPRSRLHHKRPPSRDEMDGTRRPTAKDADAELRHLRRELDKYALRLAGETKRANLAEMELSTARATLAPALNDVPKDDDSLAVSNSKMQSEIKRLKAELEDARSHIFSLQPYRTELTPEEVRRDYGDLVNGVSEWAEKFMDPVLADEPQMAELVALSKKKGSELSPIKKYLDRHPDLLHGIHFQETDVDVVIGIIMRFLHDTIFQRVLYGIVGHLVLSVGFLESSMQSNVEPRRDLFAIRNWMAEAYNAIICAPQFRQERGQRMMRLTEHLADLFRPFCKDRDNDLEWSSWLANFQEHCIMPAMKLHEKFLTSTHHFYCDVNPYMPTGGKPLQPSGEFLTNLHNLDCENILQHRKRFDASKMNPPPDMEDLLNNMTNIMTTIPGLYMRKVGQHDAIKEPMLVRKQQMLVAYGTPERRDKMSKVTSRTLLNQIYYAKSERREGGLESLVSGWRWPG